VVLNEEDKNTSDIIWPATKTLTDVYKIYVKGLIEPEPELEENRNETKFLFDQFNEKLAHTQKSTFGVISNSFKAGLLNKGGEAKKILDKSSKYI